MKDYYDIYYFANIKWNEINKETLENAIKTTFKHRNSNEELENYMEIVKLIEKDERLKSLWKLYQNNHSYAEKVEFEDTIKAIVFIYNEIMNISVTI